MDWQINTSLHYVIPNTHHFIGIEVNSELTHRKIEIVARPQIKIK